jgi:hypothetical protein
MAVEDIVITMRLVDQLSGPLRAASASIGDLSRQAGQSRAGLESLNTGLDNVRTHAASAAGTIGTVFAGAAALGVAGLVSFGVSSFGAAARASELTTTLRALAAANNLSFDSLMATANSIQAMGIETAVARQVTAQFVQNQLDLSHAADLARVAQDAAVISGQNSTETYDQLVHGIVTLNTEVLRQAGITVNIDAVERAYAATLGTTAEALTQNQKQQAVMNAVLESGTRIAGAYALAMEEPGKVLRSLPRVVNDLAVSFGERLLPEFGPLILSTYALVKQMGALAEEGQPLGAVFTAIGRSLATLTVPIQQAIDGFSSWLAALKTEQVERVTAAIEGFSGALAPMIAFIVTVGAQALPVVGGLVSGFNPLAVALGVVALQSEKLRSTFGTLLSNMGTFVSSEPFTRWSIGIQVAIGLVGDALNSLADAFIGGLGSILGVVSSVGQAIYESLQWLNPFAEHSPSLVSQVEDGVSAIEGSYARLGSASGAFDAVRSSFESLTSATDAFVAKFGDDLPSKTQKAIAIMGPDAQSAFAETSAAMADAQTAVDDLKTQWQAATDVLVPFKDKLDLTRTALDGQKDVLTDLRDRLADAKDAYDPLKAQLEAFKQTANDAEGAIRDLASANLVGTADMQANIGKANVALKEHQLELSRLKQSDAYRSIGDQINAASDRIREMQRTEALAGPAREAQRKAIDAQRTLVDQLKDKQQSLLDPMQRQVDLSRDALDALNLEKDSTIGLAQERVKAAAAAAAAGPERSEADVLAGIKAATAARDAALASAGGISPQVAASEAAMKALEASIRAQEKAIQDSQGAVNLAQGAYDTQKKTVDDMAGAYRGAKSDLAQFDAQLKQLVQTGELQVQKAAEAKKAADAAAKAAAVTAAGAVGISPDGQTAAGVPGVSKGIADAVKGVSDFQKQLDVARSSVTEFLSPLASLRTAFEAIGAAFVVDAGAIGIVEAMIRKTFGDAVANAIEPFLQAVMRSIPSITRAFRELGDSLGRLGNSLGPIRGPLQTAATAFGIMAGAVIAFSVASRVLAPLVGILQSFGVVVRVAAIALGTFAAPMLAVAAAIGVLALVWETNFGGMQVAVSRALAGVVPILENLGLVVRKLLAGDLAGAFDTFMATIRALGPALLGVIGAIGSSLVQGISENLPKIVAQINTWASAFIGWVGPKIPTLLIELGTLKDALVKWIGDRAGDIRDALVAWGPQFSGWVGANVKPMLDALGVLKDQLIAWIGKQAPSLGDKLKEWGVQLAGWIGAHVQDVLTELGRLKDRAWDWISQQAPGWGAALKEWGGKLAGWVGERLADLLSELGKLRDRAWSWIREQAPGWGTALKDWGGKLIGWIGERSEEVKAELGKFKDVVWKWIHDQAPDLANKLAEWGTSFTDWVTKTAIPKLNELKDALSGELQAAAEWWKTDGWPKVQEAGAALSKWINDELLPRLSDLVEKINDELLPALGKLATDKQTGFPAVTEAALAFAAAIGPATKGYMDEFWAKLGEYKTFDTLAEAWQHVVNVGEHWLNLLKGIAPGVGVAVGAVAGAAGQIASAQSLAALVDSLAKAIDLLATAADEATKPIDNTGRALQNMWGWLNELKNAVPHWMDDPPWKHWSFPQLPNWFSGAGGASTVTFRPPTGVTPGGSGGVAEQAGLAIVGQAAQLSGASAEAIRVLQAIAKSEAGLGGAVGDNGTSFGAFQFHIGGQLNNFANAMGLSLSEAGEYARTHISEVTEYAVNNYLGKAIQAGIRQGLSGPALAEYAARYGQVTAFPERAAAAYRSLFNAVDEFEQHIASIPAAAGPANQALVDMGIAATRVTDQTSPAGQALDDLALRTGNARGAFLELTAEAVPATNELQQAIDYFAQQNPVWGELQKNAAETGRSLKTYLQDIGALAIDTNIVSIEQLTQMSGLSFLQVQKDAQAAGLSERRWLLEVGVPAAEELMKQLDLTSVAATGTAIAAAAQRQPVNNAATAWGGLGDTMGDVATNQATQIAAVLLQLRDGLIGAGAYAGNGLIAAVQAFIDMLNKIPRDISVNVRYVNSGGPSGEAGGGGGGGVESGGVNTGSNEGVDMALAQKSPAYRDQLRSAGYAVGEEGGSVYVEKQFDTGGWLMPGVTLARNLTGVPERVISPSEANGGGAQPINITVHVAGNVSTETDLVNAIHRGLLQKQGRNGALGFQ